MGQQNHCCGQKQFEANAQYAATKAVRANRMVSKKVAEDILASIVRKKMHEMAPYRPKNATLLPKGLYCESYEEVNRPKGFYHGEWSDDKFHGQGQFFFKDGSYYQGTFSKGVAQGQGRYIFNNGCIYEGQIENNVASGNGTYSDPFQNYEYSGQWKDDVIHGYGKEKFQNGSYYEGDHVKGNKQGYGHYVCESGVYEGQFRGGTFNGEGTFTYTDGRVYKGQWANGLIAGYGIFTWPDGNRYEGQYRDGYKEGKGTFFFSNGKIFRGRWLKGLKHGPGELKLNNRVIPGIWKDGQLQRALDEQEAEI